MRPPRVYRTEAVVLKHQKLGEADKILTLYTPHLGKLRAVAKGIRRPQSRLAGHLELLTHTELLIAHGQNLDIVTQSQTIESFLPLRNDLRRTAYGLYIAELVDQFTEERLENYPLFRLLVETLNWLCSASNGELVLRFFELHLLGALGYRPQLQNCLRCDNPLTPTINYFSASEGGMLCPSCAGTEPKQRALSVNALKVLRQLQAGEASLVARLRADAALMAEIEMALREYITFLLEREPKSVGFLDMLRRQARLARPIFEIEQPSPAVTTPDAR